MVTTAIMTGIIGNDPTWTRLGVVSIYLEGLAALAARRGGCLRRILTCDWNSREAKTASELSLICRMSSGLTGTLRTSVQ